MQVGGMRRGRCLQFHPIEICDLASECADNVRCCEGSDAQETQVKEDTSATLRCIPFDQPASVGACLMTGGPATEVAIFAKSYWFRLAAAKAKRTQFCYSMLASILFWDIEISSSDMCKNMGRFAMSIKSMATTFFKRLWVTMQLCCWDATAWW